MLSEQNRQKLDSIVSQMVNNNESDEDIQTVVNDFKSKYDIPETKKEGVSAGVKSLIQQNISKLSPKTTFESPKQSAIDVLNIAQTAGGFLPMGASGITTTPATEFAIQKLKGQPTAEALEQAGIAGAGDIGITALTGGLPPAFGKFASRAITNTPMVRPAIAKILSGIPQKASEIAIKAEKAGENIFKKDVDYEKLALKMQNSLKKLKSEAGVAVADAKESLKNIKVGNKTPKFETNDISDYINNEISKTTAPNLGSSLDPIDLNKINEFNEYLSKLKNGKATPEQLLNLKSKLHNLIDSYSIAEVPKPDTNGQRILKGAADVIKNKLDDIADNFGDIKLKESNQKYHEISKLQEELHPLLGGKTQSITEDKLRNVFEKAIKEEKPTIRYEKELNKLSKDISDDYRKALAAEQYDKFFPESEARRHLLMYAGGGAGTAAGFGHPEAVGGFGALLAAMSPKTHKLLAQASRPAISKPAKITSKQLFMRINDLLNQQSQDQGV